MVSTRPARRAARRAARGAILVTLVALACVTPARAEPPAELVVTLRPRAVVGPRSVRIGDVADLSGGSPPLREAVAALDLTDAGAAHSGVTVKRQQVEFRIRLAEVPAGLFRVEGADETRVERDRCTVPEAEVVAAARAAILKLLPWGADDVSVQLVQPVAAQLVVDSPRAEILIKAEPHSGNTPLGRVQMDVSFWADGTRQLVFPVYLDVRLYQKVAVASHKIERGEALSETNVSFDRRPVESLRDYLSSPEAVAGKRARQALLPGRILTAVDVEDDGHEVTPPLVRRGEAVKLLVRLGPVNVMATGEALQDGRVGQSVRVRNTDSKQVVLGRVTERSLVEVDP
jgi:flagellar basal body P-ring formation protein FlgA